VHVRGLVQQNGTSDDAYLIRTGVDDVATVGQIVAWANPTNVSVLLPTLPWWGTPYANMINGTDGTLYPPHITTSAQPYIFVSNICRLDGVHARARAHSQIALSAVRLGRDH